MVTTRRRTASSTIRRNSPQAADAASEGTPATASPMWACPNCGQRFRNPKQWHSCAATTVESHFAGKPLWIHGAYEGLLAALRERAPVRVDAVKTSINLAGRAHFGGLRVNKSGMTVGFLLQRRIVHPRIERHEELGRRWSGHFVKITRPEDVDAELIGWLAEALALKS